MKTISNWAFIWLAMAASACAAEPTNLADVNDDTPITVGLFARIAEETLPSIVSINVHHVLTDEERADIERFRDYKENPGDYVDDPEFMEFMNRYFGPNGGEMQKRLDAPEDMPMYSGAGVVYDEKGHIVTNSHLIPNSKNMKFELEVELYDGRKFRGDKVKVVAWSDIVDIALLKIEADDLDPATFGDSDKVRIAEHVLALGHPLQLVNSVSEGIISAKGRDIDKSSIEDYLQTTAMINPGNSGGALVNMRGQVIGINVAIATSTQTWQGIGFAVPSNTARDVVDNLIKSGREGFGYLGVRMVSDSPLADQRMEYLAWHNLKDGVVVEGVVPEGPAAKAGIQTEDIIVQVDDVDIEDNGELIKSVAQRPIGDKVKLKIFRPRRNGELKEMKIEVVLGDRPSRKELEKENEEDINKSRWDLLNPKEKPEDKNDNPLGLEFDEGDEGLVIWRVLPKSPALRAGLLPGDEVLQINYVDVDSIDDLDNALRAVGTHAHHMIIFKREGVRLWLCVKIR